MEHNREALLGISCSFLSELLPLPSWSQALGSHWESESTEPQLADTLPPVPRSPCPHLKFFSIPHSSRGAGTTVDRACCGQSLSPGRHQGTHSPHCPTGQTGHSPFRRLHLGTNKHRDRQATRKPLWLHVCILQHLPESYQMFSLLLQLLPQDAGWAVTLFRLSFSQKRVPHRILGQPQRGVKEPKCPGPHCRPAAEDMGQPEPAGPPCLASWASFRPTADNHGQMGGPSDGSWCKWKARWASSHQLRSVCLL